MVDPWIQVISTVVVALLACLGVGFFNPYNTFRLQSKHGKLEKNIALKDSLPASKHSRELDYLISKQTKEYVETKLRKEIKPHWIFQIALYATNILLFLIGFIVAIPVTPDFILKYISYPQSLNTLSLAETLIYLVLWVIILMTRIWAGKKASETDFNYGYYGAYLREGDSRTPQNILLRIPKYSLSEKEMPKGITTHERIYVDNQETGYFHVYKLSTGPTASPRIGTAEFSIFAHIISKNTILIHGYDFEKYKLADEVLREDSRIFIIPSPKELIQEVKFWNRLTSKISHYLYKFGLNEILRSTYFLDGDPVQGILRRSKDFSWWQQIKNNGEDVTLIEQPNEYPYFR